MKTQIVLFQILLIIIINEVSYAQITFQKSYGTMGSNAGLEVKQTADSNYIVTGYVEGAFLTQDDFRTDAPYTNGSIGSAKMFLMKINLWGDTIWTKTFGGDISKDFGNSAVQTFDGGYAITGSTESYGIGMYDVILIKTDLYGNEIWSRTYGGLSNDGGNNLKQTSDSGFIIGGSTVSYGTLTEDFYLIKTDANGDTLWTKTYGGAGTDYITSVNETNDGGYIVSGGTDSFGADSLDILLIKTNSNGDTLWTKKYGGIRNDYCNSVKQTLDSGYLILGTTSSFGSGGFDMYLIKTDGAGNIMWNKTYGGSNNESGNAVQQTSDGGFVVAGNSSISGILSGRAYIIRLNLSGDTIWTNAFNAMQFASFYDCSMTNDNGFIFSGIAFQPQGWMNLYLVKTDSLGYSGCYNGNILTTVGNPSTQVSNILLTISSGSINTSPVVSSGSGISVNAFCITGVEETTFNTSLKVFPNPFQSELILKETKSQGQIILFDISGKQILKQKAFDTETKINTEKLLPGFYLLNYTEGNKTANYKVIKH